MNALHTLALAGNEQFTIHATVGAVAETLGGRLRKMVESVSGPSTRGRAKDDFFRRSSHLACLSAPVTSLRHLG